MVKIKLIRAADTVVGGFRYGEKGGGIGSLLLGLYNGEGLLDQVGFTSSFNSQQRQEPKEIVEPLVGGSGFTGRVPAGPSRWSIQQSNGMAVAETRLGCRSQVLSLLRRPLSSWHKISSLGSREKASRLYF